MFIRPLNTPGGEGQHYMTDITIENIVAHAQIADTVDIKEISEKLPEAIYNPEEFSGLTYKIESPKTAILLLQSGKAICTGVKSIADVERAIKKFVNRLEEVNIKLKDDIDVEIKNIIVSSELKKELHLSSISKGLLLENVDYEPAHFPGLIYRMDDIGATLLLFGSGKIVCTGTNVIEEATNAIEIMKEKLSQIGAL
jgi:transcription initiation factor TFIID TATA-box-binding protein